MIYLDNAATTWPKPEGVVERIREFLTVAGGNSGRGGHAFALQASRIIFQVREDIAHFFGVDDPTCVIFTQNTTQALNQALFGYLNPGDHVITSSLEHNAVSRPLWILAQRGIGVTEIAVQPEKEFPWEDYKKAFTKKTKLVVTLHASNVTGTVLPIERIGKIARAKGALHLVDAAQTAGIFPLNFRRLPIDMLAFPGHKGLLGPQGTGGLILRPKIILRPLIFGGTGSLSESDQQPDFLPDALESGTLNGVGIAGLGAGIEYLKIQGIDNVRKREQALCRRLISSLNNIPDVQIYGGQDAESKAPIVA
ncbi:MAG: aminotransferase class V-fold PLP-dependent enzyme, partial [Desulfitobacteriaceae bacterium]|nr:aminotransferase class V-fold PLP-dependent enzyme [Desulfitobacteriaceae bacterium]